MLPNWLIAIFLVGIAAWKIKRVLRYRNHALFIHEVAGNEWVDKSKLDVAVRHYIYIESWFFISLPLFAAISYLGPIVPYLWPFGITIMISHVWLFLWWDRKYSAKKKQKHLMS